MDWFAIGITYAVMWWLVLFMVLPLGVSVPEARDKIEYAAAPEKANMKRKLLLTSVLAIIPTAVLQCAIQLGWLDGVVR